MRKTKTPEEIKFNIFEFATEIKRLTEKGERTRSTVLVAKHNINSNQRLAFNRTNTIIRDDTNYLNTVWNTKEYPVITDELVDKIYQTSVDIGRSYIQKYEAKKRIIKLEDSINVNEIELKEPQETVAEKLKKKN